MDDIGLPKEQQMLINAAPVFGLQQAEESIDSNIVVMGAISRSIVADLMIGKTTQVKTYADLVTSIINPSHKLSKGGTNNTATAKGQSRMRHFNEFMTVEELTNLVTFLESRYEILVPTTYGYSLSNPGAGAFSSVLISYGRSET
jgi:hypothetical protein